MECTKKKYNNKNVAMKHARYYEKIYGNRSRAYGCKICNKVHLTTVGKRKHINLIVNVIV